MLRYATVVSRVVAGPAALGALLALLGAIAAPDAARAADYGAEIDVESEPDLYDLQAQGAISDETLETLLELLRSRVDVNTATREELYALPGLTYAEVDGILEQRRRTGFIQDPTALATAGVLAADKVRRLAPFLIVPPPPKDSRRIAGRAQLRGRFTAGDPIAPPLLFRTRIGLPRGFSAGLALTTTRFRLGPVSHDPTLDLIVARPPSYRANVPKLFASWRTARTSIVVGTFRLGFAERLTLDNTRQRTPDGVYPDDLIVQSSDSAGFCRYSTAGGADPVCADEGISSLHVTPDFRWQDGFRGLAASVRGLELGPTVRLALHGFGSYRSRSIYQYEIYDRGACADPRDGTPDCGAPPVFEAPNATRRFAFVTLPDIYDELAGGGNATLALGDRAKVGLTGYYAAQWWRLSGVALDFQESSPYPFGGPFGAVGANGAIRAGAFGFFLEGARSLDHTPGGGGGFGLVQRSVHSLPSREIELSLRYYDRRFGNPYARPVSAPSELEGLRARNELGARLRAFGAPSPGWRLRAVGDLWMLPTDGRVPGTAGTANLDIYARADFVGLPFLEVSAWLDYVNKDLGQNGPGACYDVVAEEVGFDPTEANARVCHGELHRLTGRLAVLPPGRFLAGAVQYGHALVTDPRYPTFFRQDALLWGELTSRPLDAVRLRLRCRYLRKALDDDSYLERELSTYLDVVLAPGWPLAARARYGVVAYLDQRPTTLARRPNPEHRMQLDLESRF